jgi:hypothetical protein
MVRIAVFLALAAFLVAVGVFVVPIAIDEPMSWRAEVGATLTTAIALILGALALLITARVESSDYKAQEETKTDIARLLATLAMIQNKGALWRTQQITSVDYAGECASIEAFAKSTTGFALYNLAAQKSRAAGSEGEEWRVFFLYIAEIATNGDNPGLVLNRAIRVQEMILKLGEQDLRFIGKSVSNLIGGISGFEKALDDNVLIKAMRSAVGEEQGGMDPKARAALVQRQFEYLKAQGVSDPNIDMFLAVGKGDRDALQAALDAGADTSITDSAVLKKYEAQLANFKP